MELIFLAISIYILAKSADLLIDTAETVAKLFHVSSLVTGLTIVAIGTSLPEFIINVISALRGSTEIAFGNVIGSNITNVFLVLGLVAIICPPTITKKVAIKELPLSILATVALLTMSGKPSSIRSNQAMLTRLDGVILASGLIGFLYILYTTICDCKHHINQNDSEDALLGYKPIKILFSGIAGIVGLYFGGEWTVNSAISIAQSLKVPQFLISSTIIAFGTSLPELVTSIKAALRRDSSMAIGSVIGSNTLNILWVLGITTLIRPVPIPPKSLAGCAFFIIAAFQLGIFMFVGRKFTLEKWQGIILIFYYTAYIVASMVSMSG